MEAFALERLELENYRMFSTLSVDFDEHFTILAGDNGSGKSTILDAARVAIGSFFIRLEANNSIPINRSDVTKVAHDYDGIIKVESLYPSSVSAWGRLDNEGIKWSRSLNTDKGRTTREGASSIIQLSDDWLLGIRDGDSDLILPALFYYGTNRLWKSRSTSAKGKIEMKGRLAGYDNCLDACVDYELMRTWFKTQAFSEFQRNTRSKPYRVVCDMLGEVLSSFIGCDNVIVSYNAEQDDISLEYNDHDGAFHYDLVSATSDGYRDIFVLLADIAFRMTLLNPMLGDDVLRRTPGIVLIDEIDLHLHPKWQAYIVPALRKAFPLVQFIGTSHSPIVISSAKKENIRLIDREGVFLPPSETYGSAVDSVLSITMEAADDDFD